MEEFKRLENLVTESMATQATQMNEFRAMFEKLMKPSSASSEDKVNDPPKDPKLANSGDVHESVVDLEAGKSGETGTPTKKVDDKKKEDYTKVGHTYPTPDLPVPHPRINNCGDPPPLDLSAFVSWSRDMKSHVKSSSIELWRIIEQGFKPHDPDNFTRREVVDGQLNATAMFMIEKAVGKANEGLIAQCHTAKEYWDTLQEAFVGNESMKKNRFNALSNETEGFFMMDGENHEDMYRRLKAKALNFKDHGATWIDDEWIKRKYLNALLPFEADDIKSLQGRHNFNSMTSNEVVHELTAFKVAAKNAEDTRARALGMHKASTSSNLALKAKVVDHDEDGGSDLSNIDWSSEGMKYDYNEHMAFYARNFWKNPTKAKEEMEERSKSSGKKGFGGPRMRTCYNCNDNKHFVVDCPYEKRDDHGGRLVLKDKSKLNRKKPFIKKGGVKKGQKIVLVAQETYSSGEESEEDEEKETPNGVAAIATTSIPSLFESPNENITNKTKTHHCLMARASEVSPSLSSTSKTMNSMHDVNDIASLKVKEEVVALNDYLTNLQGVGKVHFNNLARQLSQALADFDEKCKIEREDAIEIASLKNELEEEHELRVSLEEKLESLEETHNESMSKLIKNHDHAIAKYKVLKKEKVEFGVVHAQLSVDFENLNKAHKALESELSKLTKSHEQLQIQLAQHAMPSSSSTPCDHANLVEENARLKDELAKAALPKGKKDLDDLLSMQRPNNGKAGLGYVPKAKKKKNKKKTKPAQAKKDNVVSGNANGKATHDDFAGKTNPHYILFRDYYGDVYAKYVGPKDGFIAWSIWVPKTLVANKRGPIEKWVPKTKA